MTSKRNNFRYELKTGKKVVYRGITDNPDRRENEHKNDGKKFSHMNVVGPAVTRNSAEKWEEKSLKTYRDNHGGKNPKYNDKNK